MFTGGKFLTTRFWIKVNAMAQVSTARYCNKATIKDPTTPQVCRYTAL